MKQKGSHQLMQQLNTSLILELIKNRGPISRAELAKKTKLSNPAVSALVAPLIEQALVQEIGVAKSSGGRPPRLLQFNPKAGFLIGVDIGGTKMAGALVDLAGGVVARKTIASKSGDGKSGSVDVLIKLIRDLKKRIDLPASKFKGIGLGIPGVTDSQGQRVHLAPGIGWENMDIGAILTEEFGVPLFADNDANCFARGEFWKGGLKGVRNGIAITIGTGIGVGIIINGHVYKGSDNASGEVGYWLLGEPYRIQRYDGFGPLESLTSGTGIAMQAKADLARLDQNSSLRKKSKENSGEITAEDVFREAKKGDRYAEQLVERTTTLLGILFANMASLLNVEKIVVGGGVSRAGDQLLTPIIEIVDKLAPYPPDIAISNCQEDAAILGAVAGVLEQYKSNISYSQLG